MSTCEAARAHYPDEEPDTDSVSLYGAPGCGFCGIEGHISEDCSVRPLEFGHVYGRRKKKNISHKARKGQRNRVPANFTD